MPRHVDECLTRNNVYTKDKLRFQKMPTRRALYECYTQPTDSTFEMYLSEVMSTEQNREMHTLTQTRMHECVRLFDSVGCASVFR